MVALVTGGSGSGKSAWAEALICTLRPGEKYYLAAMVPSGREAAERIARHRSMRAGKGFVTLECQRTLSAPIGAAALLECMSNLTANIMFAPDAPEDCVEQIWGELAGLMARCDPLVIVSNEVFSDGVDYGPETCAYLAALGELNRRIAAGADVVAEVVCGIPLFLKGGILC